MLLAFQRDDSTSQHRQHRREMGQNSCMYLLSLYASVQIVYAFVYICECVWASMLLGRLKFCLKRIQTVKNTKIVGGTFFFFFNPLTRLTDRTTTLVPTCAHHFR